MSEENVELVRRATDAFAAEDVEELVGCVDPAIEFEPHLAGVEGSYSGREGIREFMADAFETLEMRGMDYGEIRDLGDRVMALGTFHIHGRESGIEDDIPFPIVVTIRAGLILHLKDYGNRVLALEAVGLARLSGPDWARREADPAPDRADTKLVASLSAS